METSIESAGEQQVLIVEQKAGPDNKRSTCYTKTFGFFSETSGIKGYRQRKLFWQ